MCSHHTGDGPAVASVWAALAHAAGFRVLESTCPVMCVQGDDFLSQLGNDFPPFSKFGHTVVRGQNLKYAHSI